MNNGSIGKQVWIGKRPRTKFTNTNHFQQFHKKFANNARYCDVSFTSIEMVFTITSIEMVFNITCNRLMGIKITQRISKKFCRHIVGALLTPWYGKLNIWFKIATKVSVIYDAPLSDWKNKNDISHIRGNERKFTFRVMHRHKVLGWFEHYCVIF